MKTAVFIVKLLAGLPFSSVTTCYCAVGKKISPNVDTPVAMMQEVWLQKKPLMQLWLMLMANKK